MYKEITLNISHFFPTARELKKEKKKKAREG